MKTSEAETGNNMVEHNGGPKRRRIQPSATTQSSAAYSWARRLSDDGKENSQMQSSSTNSQSGSVPEVIDLDYDDDDDVMRSSQKPANDVALKQLLMREIHSEIEIETKHNLFLKK